MPRAATKKDPRKQPRPLREAKQIRPGAWAPTAGKKFSKDYQPKNNGRPKGTGNKVSRVLKEAIILAAECAGSNKHGKDKLVGYLYMLAIKPDPVLFVSLLRAVLPLQVVADVKHSDNLKTAAQVRAELKARGLPDEAIYRLEHGGRPAPPMIEGKANALDRVHREPGVE